MEASSGAAALTDNATPLSLGGATPHTLFLSVGQREIKTGHPHCTLGAHRLGHVGGVFILWIERFGIEAPAGTPIEPGQFLRPLP